MVTAVRKSAVQPDPGAVHVNRTLTNLSIAYDPIQDGYVADRVFPVVDVTNQTDVFWTFDKSYFLRDEVRERAPLTESAGGGYEQAYASYLAKKYSVHQDVPDEVRANTDMANADEGAQQWVTSQMWLHREITFANKAMTTGVWGTDVTGVAGTPTGNQVKQWNDAAATPINDIFKWSTAMQTVTGRRGTKLVLGRPVWDALKQHPTILDLLKYGQTAGNAAKATKEAVAALLEVDEILVMEGIYNSAKEGATPAYNFIGGKVALLVNTPARPALRTASAGYTFQWSGLVGSANNGVRIKKFRMDMLSADRIEGDMAYDQKVVATDLGIFFTSLIA